MIAITAFGQHLSNVADLRALTDLLDLLTHIGRKSIGIHYYPGRKFTAIEVQ